MTGTPVPPASSGFDQGDMAFTAGSAQMSSNAGDGALFLKNAHVIDPSQGIDRVADVLIENGTIRAVGEVPADPETPVLDLTGSYLTPGWIDLHVHAYGT